MRGKGSRVPQHERDEIIQLRSRGMKYWQIEEMTGWHRNTVGRILTGGITHKHHLPQSLTHDDYLPRTIDYRATLPDLIAAAAEKIGVPVDVWLQMNREGMV